MKSPESAPTVSRFIRERWQDTIRIHTEDEGTHLGLPYPHTVPCAKGGFEHLYYWDIYFTCRGLDLHSGPRTRQRRAARPRRAGAAEADAQALSVTAVAER